MLHSEVLQFKAEVRSSLERLKAVEDCYFKLRYLEDVLSVSRAMRETPEKTTKFVTGSINNVPETSVRLVLLEVFDFYAETDIRLGLRKLNSLVADIKLLKSEQIKELKKEILEKTLK